MNGTCKECQPVKAEGQDEAYLYTFYNDVATRPEINDAANQIHSNVQKTVQNMKKHLMKFKKYKSLWKADKVNLLKNAGISILITRKGIDKQNKWLFLFHSYL